MEENGLGKILGRYNGRMKLRCTVLGDNLEPKMLREDVQRHLKYECREAKCNDFALFDIIKEKARAQHKYHVLAQDHKAKLDCFAKKDKSPDGTAIRERSPDTARPQLEFRALEALRVLAALMEVPSPKQPRRRLRRPKRAVGITGDRIG
ncbi:hypothetical protein PC129_g22572 [Phytophthora cactorum]|nr:hypothetical protein Pcac1_g6982 [Phytophthora cactorum]KAG2794567.1 hypothetical protein PC112_g22992 [Phytophthora cactorum]KAG2873834.1 hypothetical protein PC114_g25634 [Phytophthora cactorum]KAG2886034.1 hypothetical protein PC117_g25443 [Phytophthora cactorum]KAG2979763.1 hypothetical protein PC120_g25086 [Phytophthora cactorum]